MAKNFTPPSGFRDFDAVAIEQRAYLLGKIKAVFKRYGFVPIETPTMERIETLAGQYGDEEQQLIFNVLRSGEEVRKGIIELIAGPFAKNLHASDRAHVEAYSVPLTTAVFSPLHNLVTHVCNKALRYDLTVPLARYVQNHQEDIAFPFRRYQIQPVWRADRPQRGRYREFLQCDADIVGSHSLLCETEILLMVHEIFDALAFKDFVIRINHRQLLEGFRYVICPHWSVEAFATLLDKADKIGREVVKEQICAGAKANKTPNYEQYVDVLFGEETNEDMDFNEVMKLEALFKNCGHAQATAAALEGTEALKYVAHCLHKVGYDGLKIHTDNTLARGLSYYTGTIFEVKALANIGSLAAGGRYQRLTERFDMRDTSGIGISFGIDRMSEVINMPTTSGVPTAVLIIYLARDAATLIGLQTLYRLRNLGIAAELYPAPVKIKKQFKYAEKKGIVHTLIIEENGTYCLKDITRGIQKNHTWKSLISHLKN